MPEDLHQKTTLDFSDLLEAMLEAMLAEVDLLNRTDDFLIYFFTSGFF